jgi:hypothetical protein
MQQEKESPINTRRLVPAKQIILTRGKESKSKQCFNQPFSSIAD